MPKDEKFVKLPPQANPNKNSPAIKDFLTNTESAFKLPTDLKYIFPSWFFRNKDQKQFVIMQEKLKSLAFFEINKEFDILHLVRKLKQIDKIKDIFLNESQRILLEISLKTHLSLKKMAESTVHFRKRLILTRFSKEAKRKTIFEERSRDLQKNFEAFCNIEENEANDVVNKKVLGMLDSKIKDLFREIQRRKGSCMKKNSNQISKQNSNQISKQNSLDNLTKVISHFRF